jgi:hypothetical protein
VRCLVLLIAVGLALSATPALAKKKHKKKGFGPVVTASAAGNTITGAGQISSATANCPAGTKATGGGFSIGSDAASFLTVFKSMMTAGGAGWTASATRGSGAITAYAYCRRTGSILDVTATGTLPSGSGQRVIVLAACPAGAYPINGGFEATFGPLLDQTASIVESRADLPIPAGSWRATAQNSAPGAQTITVHAYCLRGIRPPLVVGAINILPAPHLVSVSATSPSCPKASKPKKGKKKKPRRRLSAGGFTTSTSGTSPFPVYKESRLGVGVWTATAVNAGSAATMPVAATGVCF